LPCGLIKYEYKVQSGIASNTATEFVGAENDSNHFAREKVSTRPEKGENESLEGPSGLETAKEHNLMRFYLRLVPVWAQQSFESINLTCDGKCFLTTHRKGSHNDRTINLSIQNLFSEFN